MDTVDKYGFGPLADVLKFGPDIKLDVPTEFAADINVEYVVPGVRPVILSGDAVVYVFPPVLVHCIVYIAFKLASEKNTAPELSHAMPVNLPPPVEVNAVVATGGE